MDFEIGKVRWLSLEETAAVWADAIEAAAASGRADKADVVRVVEEKKFDSRMFAGILCDLYEEAVGE